MRQLYGTLRTLSTTFYIFLLTSRTNHITIHLEVEVIILNNRIKDLRIALQLTQEDFGKRIGSARNTIANYETGNRNPSNAVIMAICKEFNINEQWLRTGEGEMFVKRTPDEDLAFFMGQLLSKEDDTPKKMFFRAMSKLPDEWFLELFNAIKDEYKKNE